MRILFNLRNSRILEFVKLYRWQAIPQIVASLKQYRKRPTQEIRERYRICRGCPIYNRNENSCLTQVGDRQLGCGCYVPYMIQVKKECWGKEKGIVEGW
jgi:hypothetical protein